MTRQVGHLVVGILAIGLTITSSMAAGSESFPKGVRYFLSDDPRGANLTTAVDIETQERLFLFAVADSTLGSVASDSVVCVYISSSLPIRCLGTTYLGRPERGPLLAYSSQGPWTRFELIPVDPDVSSRSSRLRAHVDVLTANRDHPDDWLPYRPGLDHAFLVEATGQPGSQARRAMASQRNQVDPPSPPALATVGGNISNGGELRIRYQREDTPPQHVSIFDVAGRWLKDVKRSAGSQTAATADYVWDTRTEAGHPVPRGVYFATIPESSTPGLVIIVLGRKGGSK